MTDLVFGGAGFVGAALVAQLIAAGRQVKVFDVKPYRHPLVESIVGDIRDAPQVADACRGAETVYQTISVVDWGPGKRAALDAVNVEGNRHVIAGCLAAGVRRLVYSSSIDAVFDGSPIVCGGADLPYPARHLDDYSHTKALAEQDVLRANGTAGLLTCALRLAGVYGPGDPHRMPNIVRLARAGRMLRVGDGRARFNHVYVENAAHAHVCAAAALSPGSPAAGRAYFVVDHAPQNFYAFFDPFLRALGLPVPARNLPTAPMLLLASLYEAAYRLHPGEHRRPPLLTRYVILSTCRDFYFDPAPAAADLGYTPIVSEAEAFARTVEWLKTLPR